MRVGYHRVSGLLHTVNNLIFLTVLFVWREHKYNVPGEDMVNIFSNPIFCRFLHISNAYFL